SAPAQETISTSVEARENGAQFPAPIEKTGPLLYKDTLSPTARDLIKLSDWILLAKAANVPVKPEVLAEVHRQPTKTLGKEGITLLNESGPY
ncbi:hypothetical protein, partial [Salmonella sp. SAL04281]|uniref:hypothetical protein n=1 Tax=Salmonella sp. SAL04281 TaxID=3159859 RepID=UPI00397D3FC4